MGKGQGRDIEPVAGGTINKVGGNYEFLKKSLYHFTSYGEYVLPL